MPDQESFERVSFWMREVDMHNSKTVSIIQMPKILLGNVDSKKESVDLEKALVNTLYVSTTLSCYV